MGKDESAKVRKLAVLRRHVNAEHLEWAEQLEGNTFLESYHRGDHRSCCTRPDTDEETCERLGIVKGHSIWCRSSHHHEEFEKKDEERRGPTAPQEMARDEQGTLL